MDDNTLIDLFNSFKNEIKSNFQKEADGIKRHNEILIENVRHDFSVMHDGLKDTNRNIGEIKDEIQQINSRLDHIEYKLTDHDKQLKQA